MEKLVLKTISREIKKVNQQLQASPIKSQTIINYYEGKKNGIIIMKRACLNLLKKIDEKYKKEILILKIIIFILSLLSLSLIITLIKIL